MILKIKKFLSRNIYPLFFRLYPLKKNKIIFSSFGGRNYSGNPKIISEKLYEIRPDFEIVWLINDDVDVELPSYVKKVANNSVLSAFHLYTGGIWVDDSRKTIFYKKRKKQVYFQTWHGTPLKKIEFDATDKLAKHYLDYGVKDSQSLNYLLSGNEYSSKIYKSAFRVSEEKIWNIGTPRNDSLVESTKATSHFFDKKEIKILFAPTFRDQPENNGFPQLARLGIENLKQFFMENGQNLEILLKFHPNVSKVMAKDTAINTILEDQSIGLIDDHIKIDDLFEETDLLITDYSSIFFDFSLLNKPIILLNHDEEEYKNERGFYVDLDELPIPKAKNAEEIIAIFNSKKKELLEGPEKLLEKIGNFENGTATNTVVEKIIEISESMN
ncbi:hypothetical protein A5819_000432 [Enterococcus sp. 7E2_DIV0204]|uniref:CDP-glycerol glycerophosphotransferase family protein n=1 Tax=unclassified Enterococcus TaxID=2608891 RepID=UPI000A33D5F0|nr:MULTISPECIES: CDP-glycerol glycerophosphotransferase family protein [unclassified Enterococcus]OTN87982.1 hypothetical protein A5819_000432 [Enterococcus sp. 7E2_DIV0204]OTP49342.1 hypothetical protein A5884_002538 [Enterococcus sp. 7D2_DIV0200]